jgi:hypothetical protein
VKKVELTLVFTIGIGACTAGSKVPTSEPDSIEISLLSGESPMPATITDIGLFSENDINKPSYRLVEYDVRVPLWSDGAKKKRFIYLPAGKTLSFETSKNPSYQSFTYPIGTTFVKHFAVDDGKNAPIETRIITLKDNNKWAFATYVWSDTEPASLNKRPRKVTRSGADFRIPSEEECRMCHTEERTILGFNAPQLDRLGQDDMPQIDRLITSKVITDDARGPISQLKLDDPRDTSISINRRTRAYMDVNCGTCHNPKGPEKVNRINLRLDAQDTRLVAEKKIVPGKPDESLIWQIMTRDKDRMPYLNLRIDTLGAELIRSYIENGDKN